MKIKNEGDYEKASERADEIFDAKKGSPEEKELQQSQGIAASRSRSARESFRVPIMAQTQKRADREAPPHPLSVTPRVGFVVANDARVATEFHDVSHLFTSTSVSQPAGRAPPHLV